MMMKGLESIDTVKKHLFTGTKGVDCKQVLFLRI